MSTCIRCGRKLKDQRSINRKLGPKCFQKWQKELEEIGFEENQMTIEDVAK